MLSRLLATVDAHLERDAPLMIAIGVLAMLFLIGFGVANPAFRWEALMTVTLLAPGTWRSYVIWRRLEAQDGRELLDTRSVEGVSDSWAERRR